jgi:hypothetical protein
MLLFGHSCPSLLLATVKTEPLSLPFDRPFETFVPHAARSRFCTDEYYPVQQLKASNHAKQIGRPATLLASPAGGTPSVNHLGKRDFFDPSVLESVSSGNRAVT